MNASVRWTAILTTLSLTLAACDPPLDETDADGDQVPPEVVATLPTTDEPDVALNRAIRVTFSEDLDATTVAADSVLVQVDGAPIAGSLVAVGPVVTFTPTEWLPAWSTVDVTLTTAVADLAGNGLAADQTFSFATSDSADQTAPNVVSTSPGNYATDIAVTRAVTVSFDEAPDPDSIDASTLTVLNDGVAVAGSFAFEGLIVTFTPYGILPEDTWFDCEVGTGVRDRAGNALAEPYLWHFVTGTTQAAPGSIDLQSAADFTVLGATAVYNSGATVVNGNLGVSPGTVVEGFPPGTLNGLEYIAESVAAQAQLDLGTAYDEAAAREGDALTISGDLGGTTLAPGLYTALEAIEITAGDLTLDGGGDSKAVWVFQVGGDLAIAAGNAVLLTGEARARNIYWQVDGAATLEADTVTAGNLLVMDAVTLGAGAQLQGRALSLEGAVTLDTATVFPP